MSIFGQMCGAAKKRDGDISPRAEQDKRRLRKFIQAVSKIIDGYTNCVDRLGLQMSVAHTDGPKNDVARVATSAEKQ